MPEHAQDEGSAVPLKALNEPLTIEVKGKG